LKSGKFYFLNIEKKITYLNYILTRFFNNRRLINILYTDQNKLGVKFYFKNLPLMNRIEGNSKNSSPR